MKYHVNEDTIFRKVMDTNGAIYKGRFHLTQFGNVVLVTNGNYVLPLTSVRHMVKELDRETCDCRKPKLYKPEQD